MLTYDDNVDDENDNVDNDVEDDNDNVDDDNENDNVDLRSVAHEPGLDHPAERRLKDPEELLLCCCNLGSPPSL